MLRMDRAEESGAKRAVTRTYITDRNIPVEEPAELRVISSLIFNEFAREYEQLVRDLGEWVIREKEDALDAGLLSKIEAHRLEVDDLVFGRSDEECSKTTLETYHLESGKKHCASYSSYSNSNAYPVGSTQSHHYYNYCANTEPACSSYNECEQVVDMYRKHCADLQAQLRESLQCIQQLSGELEKASIVCGRMAEPQQLIPRDLVRIVAKECHRLVSGKLVELRAENTELTQIMNEMVAWIQRNSKEGEEAFRNFPSSMY